MSLIDVNWAKVRRAVRGVVGPSVIRVLQWSARRRSWRGAQALGARIGRIGHRFHGRYRRLMRSNLERAFGDTLTDEDVEDIIRGCFEHHGMFFLETLRLPAMNKQELEEVAVARGTEHFDSALQKGRGAILLHGHLGNWEVGAVFGLRAGYPIIPLSRGPRNPRLARSVQQLRDEMDFEIIPIDKGIKGIMRALQENKLVPIMPDRFAWGDGMTVPFFGNETHVWHTPSLIAQRADCPVIPIHTVRQEDGTFIVHIEPPIPKYETDDRDFSVWVGTARCMKAIERHVREAPKQFAWHYELWRSEAEYDPPYPLEELEGLL